MKNWTINEAVKVINENQDLEAVKEIVSHFPVFAMAAAKNDLAGVAALMGEKFTLNRLSKEPIDITAENEGGVEEAPANGGKAEKAAPAGDKALEDMTTKELMKMCDARGIKVPHYGKNKQFYLEQLQGAGGAEEAAEESGEDWGDEGEAQTDPYEGKTAKELHATCKERGIKADIKKPAKFYADLLRKADAEAESGDDGEEDWGDEGGEKEAPAEKKSGKPAAKGNKPAGKGNKPTTKPADKASADDENWDI